MKPTRTICLYACGFLFVLFATRTALYQYLHTVGPFFVDDAYYYFVVARSFAQHGQSTFDGFTLTNGYHPLWLALLVLQYKLASVPSPWVTRSLEVLLGLSAILTCLTVTRLASGFSNLLFTAGFYLLLSRIALNGMETTLFVCCYAFFTATTFRRAKSDVTAGLIEGLLAVAAIAARIDAAVFVVPQIILSPGSRQRKIVSLVVVGIVGLVYTVLNEIRFGIPVPVSGEIKSLGGIQINLKLIGLLHRPTQPEAALFYAIFVFCFIGIAILSINPNYTLRPIVISFLVGFVVFGVRLTFFSSWTIWAWYDYPVIIGYLACMPYILTKLESVLLPRFSERQLHIGISFLFAVGLASSFIHIVWKHSRAREGYYGINKVMIQQTHGTLQGQRVAMGDRAGNFAFQYDGSVSQLEGIVNDAEYYRAIRNRADIKQLLCHRHVRFLIAYEPDLGSYRQHMVETIRTDLSQYPAPRIEVSASDEVIRVHNNDVFDPVAANGDKTSYLYAWRLSCD